MFVCTCERICVYMCTVGLCVCVGMYGNVGDTERKAAEVYEILVFVRLHAFLMSMQLWEECTCSRLRTVYDKSVCVCVSGMYVIVYYNVK